ncbi:uncharacterized protein TNCV_1327952 [Trichonephila clavipes]|nr:uncharacterized protein TNCV_1327952 [Trichonephila clavipes]
MFKEDNSLLRHKVGHDAHVRDVIDENITTAMCGVKSDCPFNELGYWHVTNNLVVDVMHDLLEGDKVPYNNDFWNLYLLMLTIIDTLMAPVISLPETYALAENIADHHKLFLILFPNRHLTPKMHFALHYPRIIQQLGPPVRFYQVIISMDLVEEKLKEWKLEEYLSNFENEGIDEESFFLLDDETMKLLIPKAGPRLKFKKYLNSFIEASNFSSVPTSDSTVPPCNTDITYSCINDSLTIFPHPVCDIFDLDASDEQWFSPGVRGAPATGFIADRFKNFRARNLSVVEKEELGIGQIKKNIKEKIIKYQGTEDSSVEFLQKQQWLKENTSPQDKIEAEFNMLYGEQKSDSLCLGFGMTANLIIHQAKHCGRKCAEEFANSLNFDLDSTEPSSESW